MANNRLICERAVYDWSFNDPRTLVYFCQQRMRGELLDKAAAETRRRSWPKTVLASVASAITALVAGRVSPIRAASQAAVGRTLPNRPASAPLAQAA